MANLSKEKRNKMLSFLESLRKEHTDDFSVRAFSEIENYIRSKKYGLVWEEHEENIDELLKDKIPVLEEDENETIIKTELENNNFLIEGDNLQTLYLLQKTHREKIDLIYIDPPYNTGSEDFVYNDRYLNKGDLFRHSKWISFMEKRLKLAGSLLAKRGLICISIDDNELYTLKLLCDEIFGEQNFVTNYCIQVRYAEKSLADGKQIKPVMEYVLIYAKDIKEVKINLPEEEYTDDAFVFSIKELSNGKKITDKDGSEYIVFKPGEWVIEKKENSSIDLLKETWISGTIYTKMSYGQVVRKYIEPRMKKDGTGCLYKILGRGDDGLGYRYYVGPQRKNATRCKMYSGIPLDRRQELEAGKGAYRKVPIPNHDDYAADFGNIANEGGIPFNSGKKPVKLIKKLIDFFEDRDITVLDFFAGSGSTAEAVMDKNNEDGGKRKFIICTNNELTRDKQVELLVKNGYIEKEPSRGTVKHEEWQEKYDQLIDTEEYKALVKEHEKEGICRSVTIPRLKTVITGIKIDGKRYSEGRNENLKILKCTWTPRKPEDYLLSNVLCLHIKEMIELQNAITIDNKKNILILNKDDYKEYIEKGNIEIIENVWINQNILFNSTQVKELEEIGYKSIPKEFFGFELKEAAE